MKFRMRTPRGMPTGGEFSLMRRAESEVVLDSDRPDETDLVVQRITDIMKAVPGTQSVTAERVKDRDHFTAVVRVHDVRATIEQDGDTYRVDEQYYQGHPTRGQFSASSRHMATSLPGLLREARAATLSMYSMNAVEALLKERGMHGPFPVFMEAKDGTSVGFWTRESRDQVRITDNGGELTARILRSGSDRRMRLSKALRIADIDEKSLRTYLDLVGTEYERRAAADELLASA